MLQKRQMFQTANLTGGSPLCLIGGATNELQISLGAAPQFITILVAGFWIMITNCQTYPKINDYISKALCRLQKSNMVHSDVLSDCCVLGLVQLEGKVEAVGTCK
jgi:hypothetical protein